MNKFALLLLLTACGTKVHELVQIPGPPGPQGEAGAAGEKGDSGENGNDGGVGASGSNGSNGINSVVTLLATAPGCANGGMTVLSSLDTNANGSVDAGDSNLMSAEVCNGETGASGADGVDALPLPFSPVAIIDPCGDQAGHDEVFLKLSNGTLLASFSENVEGRNTRLSILVPGSYLTTDATGCYFTVDALGNLSNEHN